MELTYTFSRALHMMRYSGAKMRLETDDNFIYFCHGIDILYQDTRDGYVGPTSLYSYQIMGNWVEVK